MERKIHVSHYKNFEYKLLTNPYYEICNLQGHGISTKFKDYIGDQENDYLSCQSLGELRILYRSWKEDNFSEMYGLFHYRRFLLMRPFASVSSIKSEFFWHGNYKVDWKDRFKLAKQNIENIEDLDGKIVVPLERDVSDFNQKNVYNDFLGAHPELERVLNRTIKVHESITKDQSFKDSLLNSRQILHFNVFYGPGRFAKELANYIFPTIEQLEVEFRGKFSGENLRWAGFIGERLFSHFVYSTKIEKKIEVLHHPVIYFDKLKINPLQSIRSKIQSFF
jgi:hypothetical protein